jgi:hypothetical protein
MLKKTKSFLFLLFFFSMPLFSHDADIQIEGENLYKSVRLPPQVYNAAHRRLFDLLIKNSIGENVPYFINSSIGKTNETRETYLMRLINSYKENDNFFFDYKLAITLNSDVIADVIATSMEFSTRNTGFAKPVNVFGSYDNIHWEFVQSDTLYVVDSKSKLNIDFNRPQKYTHYRLKLENNLEQISFYDVSLVYSLQISEETYFIESFKPEFKIETEDKITRILIDGLKHLRLCDLQIETDSMFIRNVRTSGGVEKELYNLSINGTTYRNTVLPLNRHISDNETFTVIIRDGDDKPIDITGISVRYYADDLVFQGESGGVFRLEFGEGMLRAAPVYDIERYKNEILKGPIDRLVLGDIVYVQTEQPVREVLIHRVIFNILVMLTGVLLCALIVNKLRK